MALPLLGLLLLAGSGWLAAGAGGDIPEDLLRQGLQHLALPPDLHAPGAATLPGVELGLQLRGRGAHRTLLYSLAPSIHSSSGGGGGVPSGCSLLQHLPSLLFADPYELAQLPPTHKRGSRLAVVGESDLERPAPACSDTLLVVQLPDARQPLQPWQLEVPLHSKYPPPVPHAPGGGPAPLLSGMSVVQVPAPWLACRAGTDGGGAGAAVWRLRVAGGPGGLPAWEVPAGHLGHLPLVAWGTTAAVALGSTALALRLLRSAL